MKFKWILEDIFFNLSIVDCFSYFSCVY